MSSTLLEREIQQSRERATSASKRKRRFLPGMRRRTWIILAAVTTAVTALLIWVFYFSALFALDSLVIEGLKDVSQDKVRTAAELSAGTPLASVDVGGIEERVGAIATIGEVQVTRRWPHTIVISIVERDRVGYVAEGDDKFELIDPTGFTFQPLKKKPQAIPLLDVAADNPARETALAVLTALPDDFSPRVQSVTAEGQDRVILHLNNGVTAIWGGPDDTEFKVEVLLALVAKTKHKWFDVRLPHTPTSAAGPPKPAPLPSSAAPSPSAIDPNAVPAPTPVGVVIPNPDDETLTGEDHSAPTPTPTPSSSTSIASP